MTEQRGSAELKRQLIQQVSDQTGVLDRGEEVREVEHEFPGAVTQQVAVHEVLEQRVHFLVQGTRAHLHVVVRART